MKQIYLDYAAATPMDDLVLAAMRPYYSEKFYNPSATYLAARAVRQELNDLRGAAAQTIGARPSEIIFTSGATEANNLALAGIGKSFPEAKILISAIEHDSIFKFSQQPGTETIAVDKNGMVILDKLAKAIDEQTVLVSIMLVNNELGVVQSLRDISQIILKERQRRLEAGNKLPIYLHTDAAQAANYLDLHVSRLGVDLMSINGGKIYGPKGSGMLYVKTGTRLASLLIGGGQEYGLRSGTENLPAIAGLVAAFSHVQNQREEESQRLHKLRLAFEQQLIELGADIIINGGKHRAPHLISVTFSGRDNETLMMQLDEAGIQCATGSACSAASSEPSHVLKAIGLTDEQARATLRFSLGRQSGQAELEQVVQTLSKLIKP